ncbi:MAG: DUF362 domain-containing protein [Candidatus Omnitrophica bacterium]|nr:DUF362 domain-containing protein [Candidatus Omnitrophota bacterium]
MKGEMKASSKKSKVFFKRGNLSDFLKTPQKILDGVKKSGLSSQIEKDEFVGLKVHFGEKGNLSHINPKILTSLVKFLKKRGSRPFFWDTNTLYRGRRMHAVDHINLADSHGFAQFGVPIIIGDGIKGNDYIEARINQKHFQICYLASALKDIDCLIVLSHLTGHMLTGFGAAVKNLGMGCAAKRGKLLQHCLVSPKINKEKCIGCGLCSQHCCVDAIEKENSKYFIIEEKCIGCAQCISVCPKEAVTIVWSENYNVLGEKMVEYAYAVARKRKCFYINFCLYITKECDCMNREKSPFIDDIGILFSADPVSIDKASLDLVIDCQKRDAIGEIHPQIDYLSSLQYAQEIGLGNLEYKLIEI